uniref:Prenyltransferase alpha-alpha toroid domain-containing protein n=1 Tax=Cucumis melo TaxID=3656 RepID=A0A9I9E4A9_CUCME
MLFGFNATCYFDMLWIRLESISLHKDWVVFRQVGLECGFQGRTNKLVDGCYSFRQGGICSLLKILSLDIDEQSVQPYAREGSSFDDLSTSMPSIFFFSFQPIIRACYLHQYFLV